MEAGVLEAEADAELGYQPRPGLHPSPHPHADWKDGVAGDGASDQTSVPFPAAVTPP